jgi:hypothetical protein
MSNSEVFSLGAKLGQQEAPSRLAQAWIIGYSGDKVRLQVDGIGEQVMPIIIPGSIGTTVWVLIRGSQIVALGPESTAWISPTMLNSWTWFTGVYTHPKYRRVGDRVELKGLVKSGTVGAGTPLFVLPVGFRPPEETILTTSSNDLYAQVRVTTAGNVACVVGSTVWVSLDGLSFPLNL